MFYFLEQVYLLEHFALAKIILHVILLYRLDSHLLSSEFVHAKGDLAKGTFANEFYEFVKVERGWRQLIVFLDVLLDVLDQVVALLKDGVVHFGRWLA